MATSDVSGLRYLSGLSVEECDLVAQWIMNNFHLAKGVADMTGKVTTDTRRRIDLGWSYETRGSVTKTTDIPEEIHHFGRYMCEQLGVEYDFDVVLINIYPVGKGIGKHIDSVELFGPRIVCGTLGGKRTMRFRHAGDKVDLVTEPNSVYLMEGDARFVWSHEMPILKSNDPCVSVTFRKLL